MGISSLQVCMDSSDWLQGPISEENTGLIMDSPPTGGDNCDDILACSRPLVERRLRPPHEQALKCPRCESTHTKFCYYNNYSLTQPRYFCKTCRRYWTKGGTLRNIPVGGGCRKNKKVSSSSKKPSPSTSATNGPGPDQTNNHRPNSSSLSSPLIRASPTDLQLAFPEQLQFSSIHGGSGLFNPGYLFENMGLSPVEYMGNNFMGSSHNDHIMGGSMQSMNTSHDYHHGVVNHHPLFGLSSYNEGGIDNPGGGGGGSSNHILESCQRLMLPYDDHNNHHHHLDIQIQNNNNNNIHQYRHHDHQVDVKPNAKILSLEWHDCNSDAGIKDSFGYNLGGLGSWAGLMNGYGPSATNPLV